jgi:flagellar biosynthetic protein FliR
MTVSLDILPPAAFSFLLVFARVGALAMSLPGIGDRSVPARIRLVFAMALSMIFLPLVVGATGAVPTTLAGMIWALIGEVAIGLALGMSVRLIVSALQFAGTVIAFQSGLAFAQSVDPAMGQQNALIATFLSVLSVALIFATDTHHLMLKAMHDSYALIPPGSPPPVADFAQGAIETLGRAFAVALKLSAPFIVFGLVFYFGVGILSRLIPQVQVFFLAMPANILFAFVLLMLLLGAIMVGFIDYFGAAIATFMA